MSQADIQEKTGILLVNLGTPDAPTPEAVRRYLKEFLWDKRVVDTPRIPWWLILNGIILNTRSARSARLYKKVWTEEGSPLLVIGNSQKSALQAELHKQGNTNMHVELGMRYGNPSVQKGLETLIGRGCQRILVLPLFPQYSNSTTASVSDAVKAAAKVLPSSIQIRQVNDYHDHPAYIAALASCVKEAWQEHGKPEKLMLSFHGIPQRYADNGDPYPDHCARTAHLLAEKLGLEPADWILSFQSRFGREEWLKPYTDETLQAWGEQGIKSAQVACPGFAADCLETLEEIAVENRQIFENAGGDSFHYIPALNDRPDHIQALANIVASHCAAWMDNSLN